MLLISDQIVMHGKPRIKDVQGHYTFGAGLSHAGETIKFVWICRVVAAMVLTGFCLRLLLTWLKLD